MPIDRYRARAILGGKDPTQLLLARKIGESFIVLIKGEPVEVTVAYIATNSVALMVETAEENLVLRKELLAEK